MLGFRYSRRKPTRALSTFWHLSPPSSMGTRAPLPPPPRALHCTPELSRPRPWNQRYTVPLQSNSQGTEKRSLGHSPEAAKCTSQERGPGEKEAWWLLWGGGGMVGRSANSKNQSKGRREVKGNGWRQRGKKNQSREEGATGRWGDGEGGSLQARRGPRFPLKDASQSGSWAGGLTAGATQGGQWSKL